MKTKKITLTRATASFSTAASHTASVTLPRAPWEPEPKVTDATTEEMESGRRGPRHLGTYTRRVKE